MRKYITVGPVAPKKSSERRHGAIHRETVIACATERRESEFAAISLIADQEHQPSERGHTRTTETELT